MKNRKGLSNVIATVLIILLALAAVVIMWVFVQNAVRSTASETDLRSTCLLTEVKATSCVESGTTSSVTVQLVRGDPLMLDSVVGVIRDADGATVSKSGSWSGQGVLSTKKIMDIDTTSLQGGAPFSARAAAKIVDPNNNDRIATCDLSFESVTCS